MSRRRRPVLSALRMQARARLGRTRRSTTLPLHRVRAHVQRIHRHNPRPQQADRSRRCVLPGAEPRPDRACGSRGVRHPPNDVLSLAAPPARPAPHGRAAESSGCRGNDRNPVSAFAERLPHARARTLSTRRPRIRARPSPALGPARSRSIRHIAGTGDGCASAAPVATRCDAGTPCSWLDGDDRRRGTVQPVCAVLSQARHRLPDGHAVAPGPASRRHLECEGGGAPAAHMDSTLSRCRLTLSGQLPALACTRRSCEPQSDGICACAGLFKAAS
jgi:hypothetical protein